MTALFEPGRSYELNPAVAPRPEPFGALAYHFGNRRLSFLKAPELVELVAGSAPTGAYPTPWPPFPRAGAMPTSGRWPRWPRRT